MQTSLRNVEPDLSGGHPWPMRTADGAVQGFAQRGEWPAKWVYLAEARQRTPVVCAYRRQFRVESAATIRLHVSADERYDLFLDGVRIGRGPERGHALRWYHDTYEIELAPGEHTLVARVWTLGIGPAPWSQMSIKHGFLLCPQDAAWWPALATGVADWQAKILGGYQFIGGARTAWASTEHIDGAAFNWEFHLGHGAGWQPAKADRPARSSDESSFVHTFEHPLFPPRLPALLSKHTSPGLVRHVDEPAGAEPARDPYQAARHLAGEVDQWQALLEGRSITIPAHTNRRVLTDLRNYYNAYWQLTVSGGQGAVVRVAWDESLRVAGNEKGNRGEIEGKVFTAQPDVLRASGRDDCRFAPLWWRCGRYVQIIVSTADQPLTIKSFAIEETRYPYEEQGRFECDDERFAALLPVCVRTVQNCAHESYMDCPYFEQQMWVGDMRVQMLISHVINRDPRLIRRCIEYIGLSRDGEKMVLGRYPAPQRLWIPSFALAWVEMVHDYALWRGDREFVRRMMPAVRGTLDAMLMNTTNQGLVRTPYGWNYTDWSRSPDWKMGEPPRSLEAPSAILNWQLAGVMQHAAALEEWIGEPHLAARWRERAGSLARACEAAFWREDRRLFSDDPDGRFYSEHAQCMAVLGGAGEGFVSSVAQSWPAATGIAGASLYYDFYVLEALRAMGRADVLMRRLEPYFAFAGQGLCTTPETAEPTRSDSHAWSAHPRYHVIASVLGIRPAAFGFDQVQIQPQLGSLRWARGAVPHPRGEIAVELEQRGGALGGQVVLPEGVTGTFVDGSGAWPLSGGANSLGR